MRCASCRHELTEREQIAAEFVRGEARYCRQCIGWFYRGGYRRASEWSMEQYWDHDRVPPGVVPWAARKVAR
jgi:hypothetical protein